MKKIVPLLSIFFLIGNIVTIKCMDSYSLQEKQLQENSDELLLNRTNPLQSIYKKLIPLLSNDDINTLLYLLDHDVLKDKHYYKHLIFLKYVLEKIAKNSDANYSLEKQSGRVKTFHTLLQTHDIISSKDKKWIKAKEKLDMILREKWTVPPKLFFAARNEILNFACLLHMDKNKIPQNLSTLYRKCRKEKLVSYLQFNYAYNLKKINRDILFECIQLLSIDYNFVPTRNEFHSYLNEKLEQANGSLMMLERIHSEKERPLDLTLYSDQHDFLLQGALDRKIDALLKRISIQDLKLIIHMLVFPYIIPQCLRYIFVIKLLATMQPQEEEVKSEESLYLKEHIISALSYSDNFLSIHSEVSEYENFLEKFSYFIKQEKCTLTEEDSLYYKSRFINNLPSAQKDKLLEVITLVRDKLKGKEEKENLHTSKRKRKDEDEKKHKESRLDSPEAISNHPLIKNFMYGIENLNDPDLLHAIASYLLEQSPLKEALIISQERNFVELQQAIKNLENEKSELMRTYEEMKLQSQNQARTYNERLTEIDIELANQRTLVEGFKKSLEDISGTYSSVLELLK